MTSNVELLPLYAELQGHPKLEIIKHYARAVAEHNVSRERDRAERLAEALRGLLALPISEAELRRLDKGIGTATRNAAWLRARAALRDHDQEGGNP